MLAATAASTWDVTGAQFLPGYGTLCALAALAVWHERRRVLGPAPPSRDPQPDLDATRLALLSGGPDHAITVAAAELMRAGRLRGDGVTISANGEPAATAEALEREVFEAVRREPGLSIEEVQARVRDSATMTEMTEQMTHSGLLVGGSDAARIRLLWVLPALLAAVGLARILAGGDGGAGTGAVLFALVAAAVLATVRLVGTARLAGTRPLATNRGRSVLDRRRSDSIRARLYPAAGEIGLMTALYGGGALWVADPVTASALHVPREKEPGTGGGGGGGGGGSADGWFDLGSWLGGGWFGDGDGGGCGGGGGGGGGGCGGGGGGGG